MKHIECYSDNAENSNPRNNTHNDWPVFFIMILSFSFLIVAPLLIASLLREDFLGNSVAVLTGLAWVSFSAWFTAAVTSDMVNNTD